MNEITTHRVRALALALAALAACVDPVTPPDPGSEPPSGVEPGGALGVMEVTLSGITSPATMTASVRSVGAGELAGAGSPGATAQSLDPVEEGAESGIQLEPLSSGSFTLGERGAGGQRYLSATFRVRNASADGVAYTTPLDNLTFLAVDTDGTIGQTPVSRLRLFDGSPAPTSLANELKPTGAASLGATGGLASSFPDVLQVLTEAEAASVTWPDVTVFPYGFVTRRPKVSSSRTLPAGPDDGDFDGVVTFAFRLPLEADAAADPFEISVMVLAVSDSETRVTQSFADHTCSGQTALEERADSLGATMVTLFPGAPYAGDEPTRVVSQVRTAGTAGAASSELPDSWAPPLDRDDGRFTLEDFGITPGTYAGAVVPLLAGVISDPATEEVEAFFGHYNDGPDTVTIPNSSDNMFFPSPSDRGQPTEFAPGLNVPTFTVTFNSASTSEIVWQLTDGDVRIAKASNDPSLYLSCRSALVP